MFWTTTIAPSLGRIASRVSNAPAVLLQWHHTGSSCTTPFGARSVARHIPAPHKSLGHQIEYKWGKHTKRYNRPPKFPKHPLEDVRDMKEFVTYRDLKLRWKFTTKFSRKKMNIAKKWLPRKNICPKPRPTSAFVWHKAMPHRYRTPEAPKKPLDCSDAFAIIKSNISCQHKVTVGDLIQAEKLHRREAGEQVKFGTVLMVGSRDWTILGKPTVPYAYVKCTIEQQTLAGEKLVFKYKPRRRSSNFYRDRHYVTMLRVDEIVCDPSSVEPNPPMPKATRLLDVWANRWLRNEEKELPETVQKTCVQLYDGSEHQPGTYHRRGMTEFYRFWPDPYHTHWTH
eukprot:GEMP01069893.1.p1 GENE.GEMP01069893.1~~GEMP01069893.1.p1  ORF type:complete len:340 (+),score=45.26 GEMP01069893.1:192-1211(+)